MTRESRAAAKSGWIRRVGWWAIPFLVVGILGLAVVTVLGTTTPLVVTDGISMLPTLRTGELAVLEGVTPAALRVGEIVAVRVPAHDQRTYHYPPLIVHRIFALELQGSRLMVQTKGDNHQAPEPFLVPASNVRGRLLLAIPYLGEPLLFVHSRPGEIALGGLILLALLYFALTSVADALAESQRPAGAAPGSSSSGEIASLTLAVQEYGHHLMSHTRVMQELGGTTHELREATVSQNEVLTSLQEVVRAMRAQMASPTLAPAPIAGPWRAASLPSRHARKASQRRGLTPAGSVRDDRLPSRRSRKRAARRGSLPLGR
jgi:signal peptidase